MKISLAFIEPPSTLHHVDIDLYGMPRRPFNYLVFPIPLLVYLAALGKLHYLQIREALPLTSSVLDSSKPSTSHASITSLTGSTWPALEAFVDRDGNITSQAQRLLDFAIIGFGKCGTTAVLDWLNRNNKTQCVEAEVWDMVLGHPEAMVRKLYELRPGFDYKRGYKSPREIVDSRVLRYYRTYFPDTKLLVGIRHPIRWFESLYNFRVQNMNVKETSKMRHPNALIGVCTRGMKNTCTEKGNFALHLLKLGKQNQLSAETASRTTPRAESVLRLYKRKWYNASAVPVMPNPVFLFDVEQLSDANETRSRQFRDDVQLFLGLDSELPPLLRTKPGKVWGPVVQAKKDRYRIDVCDDEYKPVRANLLRMSRLNADWIRNEFLDYPGVHFSSREFLEQILDGWMVDPCPQ
jgi:hypothetical protein